MAESFHKENFIKAVRSRKREDQNGELVEGTVSSSLSHISNISYQLGNQKLPEEIQIAVKANPAATETFNRFQEHLQANSLNLNTEKATLGMPLQIDPATMRFQQNDTANAMLTRQYRSPFILNEI